METDPDFFYNLSDEDAKAFLNRFIEVESVAVLDLVAKTKQAGLKADFSVESLVDLFVWVVGQLRTRKIEDDPTLPEWIRESDIHQQNLFEFDQDSSTQVFRMGYYFGESFARSYSHLEWSIGHKDFASCNKPVVVGFRNNTEMAPTVSARNLLRRMIIDSDDPKPIVDAVEIWQRFAEE